jgi:DNA helicase HerA-like ATPase
MTQPLLQEERGPSFARLDQTQAAPAPAETRIPPLDLDHGPMLGQVISVDASRVLVRLTDEAAVELATVSALVALRAADAFLIGILDRLVCNETGEQVTAEIMPVGTFYPFPAGGGSFRAGAAHQPRIRAGCFLVEGERLNGFMASLAQGVAHDERLLLGHYGGPDGAEAVADGNRLFQRHMAILGNSGAGKSWAVSLLLERASRLANANVLVLDLHGEYGPLDAGGVASRLRIGGPADLLYGADDVLHLPYWLFEADELLTLIGNPDDPWASDQRLWLIDRIETLKRSALASAGSFDAMNTVTADSPVPYALDLLIEWMEKDEVERIIQQPSGNVIDGPFTGKLRGLISRLEARRADPRYGFIFQPPQNTETKEWLGQTAMKLLSAGHGTGGIKTIDLSEVPTPLIPLVAGLIARVVYSIQFWMEPSTRTPVCLICDEAHVYLRDNETDPMYASALRKFEMIAKEGRKYGVCLGIVSQRPSELSRTVLSQCNNFILLRLNNDQDHKMIVHLVPGAFAGVAGLLPTLDVGEAVAIGDAVPLPVRIKLDKAEVGPASATMAYWTLWSNKPSSPEAIVDGVAALRSQSRYIDEE